MNLAEAVTAEATGEQLLECELPDTYLAAHVLRDDEHLFREAPTKDVRLSLKVGDVPMPELAPDEALIGVMASSINYNTVWSATFEPVPTFRFLERLGRSGGWEARHDLPHHVVGSDASGIIVRVGSAVRGWSVGDRVVVSAGMVDYQNPASQVDGVLAGAKGAWGFETNFGGLAHFSIVKVNQLLPKPRHLTWEEAACNTLCAMTAYRMLVSPRAAQFKQGDVVLVWGATGGLGSYAVQFVRNGGGIAVGIVSNESKASLLKQLGCDLVLRRDQLELDGLSMVDKGRRIRDAVRGALGEDPHIVLDYVGRETFGASVYVVRPGGSVVTCGSSTGYQHAFDNRYLWMHLKRIVGSHGANWQEAWEATRLLAHGKIVPTLSRVFSLEHVGEAAWLVQSNAHVGKVGVRCLACKEGLGVEDEAMRETIGEPRLKLFRELS